MVRLHRVVTLTTNVPEIACPELVEGESTRALDAFWITLVVAIPLTRR
jgi:hypothetical protein